MEKIINNVRYCLQNNQLYKKSKDSFEAKYKVLYYSDFYECWCFLYSCDSKRDFTINNIKKYW